MSDLCDTQPSVRTASGLLVPPWKLSPSTKPAIMIQGLRIPTLHTSQCQINQALQLLQLWPHCILLALSEAPVHFSLSIGCIFFRSSILDFSPTDCKGLHLLLFSSKHLLGVGRKKISIKKKKLELTFCDSTWKGVRLKRVKVVHWTCVSPAFPFFKY